MTAVRNAVRCQLEVDIELNSAHHRDMIHTSKPDFSNRLPTVTASQHVLVRLTFEALCLGMHPNSANEGTPSTAQELILQHRFHNA